MWSGEVQHAASGPERIILYYYIRFNDSYHCVIMLIQTSLRPRIVVRNARVPKHFCDNEKTFLRARAKTKQQKNAQRFRFGSEYCSVSAAAVCTTRDHIIVS